MEKHNRRDRELAKISYFKFPNSFKISTTSSLPCSTAKTSNHSIFRHTVLEDIFQEFPLVYHVARSLSHQFACHDFRILHHHDHLMMNPFKNRSRKLKSFFLNLLTAEFHHTEQIFIPEHITDRIFATLSLSSPSRQSK